MSLHWIYILTGLSWMALFCFIGIFLHDLVWRYFGVDAPAYRQEFLIFVFGSRYPWIAALFAVAGLMIAVIHFLKVIATEIALTDQRIIYKTGLIFVNVEEIDLAEIRAEQVKHGPRIEPAAAA